MTFVLESNKPYREKQRRPGQTVWVQRIEAEPKDWFECKVTDVAEDPITYKPSYRVKLVDGGAPGIIFEGKWLQPDRLRDRDDRRSPYYHSEQDRARRRPSGSREKYDRKSGKEESDFKTPKQHDWEPQVESQRKVAAPQTADSSATDVAKQLAQPGKQILDTELGAGAPSNDVHALKSDVASSSEKLNTDAMPSDFDHAAWSKAFGSTEWPIERYDPSQIVPPLPSLTTGDSTIESSLPTVSSDGGRPGVAGKRTQDGKRRPDASAFHDYSRDADMGVSDNASIRTDGREHNIPEATQELLVDTFAELIIQSLHDDVPKALFCQPEATRLTDSFLRAFSSLLGASVDSGIEGSAIYLNTATFISHKRALIAAKMAGVADAWAPTREGVLSPQEKFARWDMDGAEPPEVSEVIDDSEHDVKGISRPDEDVLRLKDVPEAKKFLVQSKEFMWLLEQVTNSSYLLQTGPSYSHARREIARAMDKRDGQLKLTLGWDVITTLNEQYPGNRRPSDLLSNMIVYIGSPSTCFATTASQYAHRVWPSTALHVLQCLELAIADSNGESMTNFEGICMQVKLNGVETFIELNSNHQADKFGPRKAILEVAELCIWLVSACRDNVGHDVVGISSPVIEVIENEPGSAATLSVTALIIPDTRTVTQKGQCWTAMVQNPVLASGYPVPKRDREPPESGLEVCMGLMIKLSRADWSTTFGDTLLLKGIISALVAVRDTGEAILWHFLINQDQQPMTYQQACANPHCLPHLNHLSIYDRRHFVGFWTTDAQVVVTSRADEVDGIQESKSKPVDHYTLTWKTLTVGGGKYGTASAGWELGKKDNAVVLAIVADHPFQLSVREARNITVLLYSTQDRRGWLIDGASALVYLARARLTSITENRENRKMLDLVRAVDRIDETSFARLMELKDIEIFERLDSKDEMTDVYASSPSEPTADSADSGFVSGANKRVIDTKEEHKVVKTAWTYEKLWLDLWQNLLLMKASLDRLKMRNPQLVFRKPGLILTGWDATDVIRRQQRQEPRFVNMLPESKQWIRYATANTAVVLMARDFGDVIQPSSAALVCNTMRQPPINQCSLAVPLFVLRQTAARFLLEPDDSLHGCVQIHDKAYLHMSAPMQKACDCSDGMYCQPISTLQRRAKSGTVMNSGPSSTNVFAQYPRAAVIIGRPRTRNTPDGIDSLGTKRLYRLIKQSVINTSQALIANLRPSDMPTVSTCSDSDEEPDSGAADDNSVHFWAQGNDPEHQYIGAPGSARNGYSVDGDTDADGHNFGEPEIGVIGPQASFARANTDLSIVDRREAAGSEIDSGADVGFDADNSDDGGSVSVSGYQSCQSVFS